MRWPMATFVLVLAIPETVFARATVRGRHIKGLKSITLFELSLNLGDGKGSGGSGLSFRLDDLNSVGEPYTEKYFRQLVVAIEATPVFLGGLGQLEDHGERGLVRETSSGAHCSVADRRE